MTELLRKTPIQERSKQTIETILDAATQVLQVEGEERFTTNRVAEKSGFSIGTLYQYFPNKNAIVEALVERERIAIETTVARAISKSSPMRSRMSSAWWCVQPSMRLVGAENCGNSSSSR
jgi:AcrR family transcriptional regulator